MNRPLQLIGPIAGALALIAAAGTASAANADLTKAQVKAKIEAAGYTNVSDIRREKNHYDAKATKDGQKVSLDVDAKTGEVTPESDEAEEHEAHPKDKD